MTLKIQLPLLLLVLLPLPSLFAQTTFNYAKDFSTILQRTKDKQAPLSYDLLLNRFKANDTTLTDFEVLALMIGFTDKPDYKPYEDLSEERDIYQLNGEGKYREGLDKANEFLSTHPLSVKVLMEKSYSFYKLEQQDSAQYYMDQAGRIFEAMYFSGDGKSRETPTFALGPADGQDYIRKFIGEDIGMMGSGRDSNGNFLDMLELKFKDGETVMLYFIIQHATNKMFAGTGMEKKLQEQKKTKKKSKE